MSRKGKAPIALPKGVDVQVKGTAITVKGPKGTLQGELTGGVTITIENGVLLVGAADESRDSRRFHGLHRSLISNMVQGASQGFEEKLEMIGVGYRASLQGQMLDLQVGNSHPTQLAIPPGIHVRVEKNTAIFITGIDKQAVGQFAAQIRAKKPPEPYQGKGIRYVGEFVRRKAGKAAKTAKK